MGVTTSALALVKEVAIAAHAPRFGNIAQQRTVLHDLLSRATSAPRPGLVVDLPYKWRREEYPSIIDWGMPGHAVVSQLSLLSQEDHGEKS